MANELCMKLINNTSCDYHKTLINGLFTMMNTLFEEKKRGKQEGFKNKILYKISYLLAIIIYKTNDSGRIDIMNKVIELLRSGTKNEMIYIMF